jgi:hypothetical protein
VLLERLFDLLQRESSACLRLKAHHISCMHSIRSHAAVAVLGGRGAVQKAQPCTSISRSQVRDALAPDPIVAHHNGLPRLQHVGNGSLHS